MNRRTFVAGIGVTLSGFAGGAALPLSQPAQSPTPQGTVIATVGSAQVTLEQLQRPLIDGYGLNVLLNLMQLEMAKQGAARSNVTVTPKDIQAERDQTIEKMFKDSNEKQYDKARAARDKNNTAEADRIEAEIHKDNEQALTQFLQNQHISKAEFDIVTQTNAYLRKMAEPMVVGKITEENLKEAFGTLYGEKLKCRHIQCANMQEIQEVKRRLATGESFAQVAEALSRNPGTRPLGGQLPPFSIQMQGLPQAFKDAAFALKEGEVSDVVQANGAYHLILLEKRIAPKVVKFEDVKESVRQDLQDRALEATIKQLREQVTQQAVAGLNITEPTLKQQWEERRDKRQSEVKDRDEVRKKLERESPATQPTGSDLAPAK